MRFANHMTSERSRTETVTVLNASGLHLRASTDLAKLSLEFSDTSIRIWKRGHLESERDPLDCRDPLQIALLVAEQGEQLELIVEGSQQDKAMDEVVAFFKSGCGEGMQVTSLPGASTKDTETIEPGEAAFETESTTDKNPE